MRASASMPGLPPLHERVGICQWFHFGNRPQLESTIRALDALGIHHLRTGISWADWHRPGGRAWYDWQMSELHAAGIEVLLSVWHTPPSISMDPARGNASIPPRRLKRYADFLDRVIDRYGDTFQHVELWNEPNNPYKWDPAYDPDHRMFAEMVAGAGHWVRQRGKTPVMGGVTLLDCAFTERLAELGALECVDIFGIHAFPRMWEPFATSWDHPDHWFGWEHRVEAMGMAAGGLPVWVTETGLATYHKERDRCCREDDQVTALVESLSAATERLYWYCMFDLDPRVPAIEETCDGPREEAEYHMGLVRFSPDYGIEGREKPAYHALKAAVAESRRAARPGRDRGLVVPAE